MNKTKIREQESERKTLDVLPDDADEIRIAGAIRGCKSFKASAELFLHELAEQLRKKRKGK